MEKLDTHQKEQSQDVVVTFNGKHTTLNKSPKKNVALADQDKMKDWRVQQEASQMETSPETAEEFKQEQEEELKQDPAEEFKQEQVVELEQEPLVELKQEPAKEFMSGPLDWRKIGMDQQAASLSSSTMKSTKKKKKMRKTKRMGQPDVVLFFRKFWLPFLSAITVGLGLGFTVLLMFSHHKGLPAGQQSAMTQPKGTIPTSSQASNQGQSQVTTVTGKDYLLNLQVVQTGFYNDKKSAQTYQTKFASMGIHTVMVQDQGYALYAGVALTATHLKVLEPAISKKTPIYGKPWVLDPRQLKGSKRDLQDLKTANLIIQNLIPLSVAAIESQQLDQSILTQVDSALKQMADPGSGTTTKGLGTLKGTLLAAFTNLNQAHPDGQMAQNALLDAIGSYQSLLNQMTPN